MLKYKLFNAGRKLIPPSARARLRRSPMLRTFLRRRLHGTHRLRFPDSDLFIMLDGYKHASVVAGGPAFFEPDERDSLVRLAGAGTGVRTVWDVGANVGLFTMALLDVLGRDVTFHCFEPDPANLALLRQTLTGNGVLHSLVEAAVSDAEGTMPFFRDTESGATGSLEERAAFVTTVYNIQTESIRIPVVSLDAELTRGRPAPQLLKIDVEGHELKVLQGAGGLLSQHKPILHLECTRQPEEVGRLLDGHGYRILSSKLEPIDRPCFNTFAVPRA